MVDKGCSDVIGHECFVGCGIAVLGDFITRGKLRSRVLWNERSAREFS